MSGEGIVHPAGHVGDEHATAGVGATDRVAAGDREATRVSLGDRSCAARGAISTVNQHERTGRARLQHEEVVVHPLRGAEGLAGEAEADAHQPGALGPDDVALALQGLSFPQVMSAGRTRGRGRSRPTDWPLPNRARTRVSLGDRSCAAPEPMTVVNQHERDCPSRRSCQRRVRFGGPSSDRPGGRRQSGDDEDGP